MDKSGTSKAFPGSKSCILISKVIACAQSAGGGSFYFTLIDSLIRRFERPTALLPTREIPS